MVSDILDHTLAPSMVPFVNYGSHDPAFLTSAVPLSKSVAHSPLPFRHMLAISTQPWKDHFEGRAGIRQYYIKSSRNMMK